MCANSAGWSRITSDACQGAKRYECDVVRFAKPNDRVLDHSFTYALIEIADANATAVGLSSSNPRVRRAAMIALDQMENGHLEPTVVTADLGANTVILDKFGIITSFEEFISANRRNKDLTLSDAAVIG